MLWHLHKKISHPQIVHDEADRTSQPLSGILWQWKFGIFTWFKYVPLSLFPFSEHFILLTFSSSSADDKTKQGRLTGKLEFRFIKLLLVSKFVSVFMRMQSTTFPLKTKLCSVTKPPEKVHCGCTPQERTRLLWRAFTNQTGVGNLVFHSWEKAKAFLLACLSFPLYILWRNYFAKFWWTDISMFDCCNKMTFLDKKRTVKRFLMFYSSVPKKRSLYNSLLYNLLRKEAAL